MKPLPVPTLSRAVFAPAAVGAAFQARREAMGYSKTRAGEMAGTSRWTIQRIESGHIQDLETLQRYGIVLGLAVILDVEDLYAAERLPSDRLRAVK